MKIVLVNGKIFRDIEIVKQTELVITIVPKEFVDTDKEEKEIIVIPWTSILYVA